MDDSTHTSAESAPVAPASGGRGRRWLIYLFGVPVVGVIYYFVYMQLVCQAIAIGDTDNPVVPVTQSIALYILSFPMTYLGILISDRLKPYLSDSSAIELFAGMNAIVWGFAVSWVISLIVRRSRRKRPPA